jgi:benzodiazapine receptor
MREIIIIIPLIFGFISGQIGKPDEWYNKLKKAPLNPPKIIFPIAWTILYLLIGISYYLIINKLDLRKDNNGIFGLMIVHLIVNYSYTPLLFYMRQKLNSAIVCLMTLIIAIVLYKEFLRIDNSGLSSYLLIPYIIWLIFANYLAWNIYYLN